MSERPTVIPPKAWSFPESAQHRLSNGLTARIYHRPGQYVASLRLVIPLTLASEPREVEGVATIMARCLDEGTQLRTAEEFTAAMESHGAAFGAGVGERALMVDLDVPVRRLGGALPLVVEALSMPRFDDEAVARLVRIRLADIDYDLANGASLAAVEFVKAYFDPEDRASRQSGGSRETVVRVTADDVTALHAAYVRPENATVVAAGDFEDVDVLAMLEATLGTWVVDGEPAAPVEPISRPQPRQRSRIVLVDRPGSVQTELYVGCPGPDRTYPRWGLVPAVAFVIGGAPTARLDALLREEKGWTYGVRAGFRPRAQGGMFLVTGSVRRDVTAPALEALVGVLRDARDGFGEDEARAALDYIAGTAPARYATADVVADEASMLAIEGLPDSWVTTSLSELGEADAAALSEIYREWVDGTFTIVAVGDTAAYGADVEALGLGEVVRVEFG